MFVCLALFLQSHIFNNLLIYSYKNGFGYRCIFLRKKPYNVLAGTVSEGSKAAVKEAAALGPSMSGAAKWDRGGPGWDTDMEGRFHG